MNELTRARHGEADEARKARDSVSRAIRVAIGAIGGVHPELAAHLWDALDLGSVIRYRP